MKQSQRQGAATLFKILVNYTIYYQCWYSASSSASASASASTSTSTSIQMISTFPLYAHYSSTSASTGTSIQT
jgi:hypothetical protein